MLARNDKPPTMKKVKNGTLLMNNSVGHILSATTLPPVYKKRREE
jgi:hypothetical protein